MCKNWKWLFWFFFCRVSYFEHPGDISEQTDCMEEYIRKGIAMACFYYGRCLSLGQGVQQDDDEAKKFYSRVSYVGTFWGFPVIHHIWFECIAELNNWHFIVHTTLCSEKKHPLTFSFISPWMMCGFKQKLLGIRNGRFWQCKN